MVCLLLFCRIQASRIPFQKKLPGVIDEFIRTTAQLLENKRPPSGFILGAAGGYNQHATMPELGLPVCFFLRPDYRQKWSLPSNIINTGLYYQTASGY